MNFPPSQEEYAAWYSAKVARSTDPDDPYHAADVMDCVNVLVLAITLHNTRPELRVKLAIAAPTIIERAGEDLGTFMGARTLGQAVGVDPEVAQKMMLDLISAAR